MLPNFCRLCRRSAAHFTAVGVTFYNTARLDAAQHIYVRVGVMLPILLLLVQPFTLRLGSVLPKIVTSPALDTRYPGLPPLPSSPLWPFRKWFHPERMHLRRGA